jgi:hypothetical protein
MNPWLEHEDAWHDFHESFVTLARDVLNAQVGENYIVKVDQHIYLHDAPNGTPRFIGRSDVSLASPRDPISPTSGATLLAPAHAMFPTEDSEEESFLEIRDRQRRQLVTVIELLSPANKKPGDNRGQYLAKRHRIRQSTAHLVEIDLLRGGLRPPMEEMPKCDYYALVSRYEDRPRAGVWPIQLRDPLPRIPVPLRAPDTDVFLDLQDMLHRIYDAAGFRKYIYDTPPDPPLGPQDTAWANQFLPGNPPTPAR